MLTSASVTANIPAADLDRARAFYADTLGLTPAMEVPEGGMLLAPLLGDPSVAESDPHGSSARSLALARVVHGLWGVPDRSPDDLATEVSAGGFVDVVVSAASDAGVLVVVATRP